MNKFCTQIFVITIILVFIDVTYATASLLNNEDEVGVGYGTILHSSQETVVDMPHATGSLSSNEDEIVGAYHSSEEAVNDINITKSGCSPWGIKEMVLRFC